MSDARTARFRAHRFSRDPALTLETTPLEEPAGESPQHLPQEDLWRAYHADPTPSARRALLEGYLSLIRFVAVKLAARLPGSVDVNDLLQEGFLGLNRAIDAFDPTRGVQFSTFAVKRIWGAMMDGLRAEDWQRRTLRRRTQKLEAARRELLCERGLPPTAEELAARLGVSQDEFERVWLDSDGRGLRSLTPGVREDGDRVMLPEDERSGDPAKAAMREDLKELLVRGFTRAERLIVVLYYYEDMTMKEIGETLDISESRVSQLHALLVKRIRSVLDAWELE
jgi:RNA polymerase sigma factor for flagellar operon FliA